MTHDPDTLANLHRRAADLGTRLFTVTALDERALLHRRLFTSHPLEYPVSGTKPLDRDGWYEACIAKRQSFVANTPPEFARHFFDHALITSLGLGSCMNIPVWQEGPVLGTVNLLAEAGHFSADRVPAYEALVQGAGPALNQILAQALES